MSKKVAVIGGVRIPFCRAGTNYADYSNLQMMTACLQGLVEKFSLKGEAIGDVSCGAVIHHSRDWNLSREAVLASGLSKITPGFVIQRACATSLEAAILIANKIALGQIDSGIAGGVDSMSDPPISYRPKLAKRIVRSSQAKTFAQKIKPWLGLSLKELIPGTPSLTEPTTGKTMGEHCEIMAKEWKISRQSQDEFAFKSHQNGIAAYKNGFYENLIVPFAGATKDNNLRADTSLERLAKLKPVFDRSEKGTLTAGNSSPLTDGASCALFASEQWAKDRGHKIQAYLTACEVAAVDITKEGLLMAPAYAVGRMLKKAGLKLQDFDFYEIHEAFAAQVLCTLRAWESEGFCKDKIGLDQALGSIDPGKINVAGGSVALGHPFGATGTRLIATLANLLEKKGKKRGLISICTGGGMGVTAILERN